MNLRILSSRDIHDLLTYPACIELIRETMKEISRRNVHMPLRHGMRVPGGDGVLGLMYGYLGAPESFGVKLLSLYPGNPAAGLSSHLGLVVLYETANGKPLAILDGSVITAIRTAAASAVATAELARPDARTLALIGTGEQAETHLRAIPEVRDIEQIRVWGRNRERAERFVATHGAAVSAEIEVCDSVEQAVAGTDIVCTVTSAPEPVLFGRSLEPGMHLNLVGSSIPSDSEVDSDLVVRSRYYVDYRESTLAQAGELLRAKEAGLVTDDHIIGEIGQVLLGEVGGRASAEEITLYKSLGIIAQDLAAASFVLDQAETLGRGVVAEL